MTDFFITDFPALTAQGLYQLLFQPQALPPPHFPVV